MADQPVQGDHGTSEGRRKGTSSRGGGKRASMEAAVRTTTITSNVVGSGSGAAPCGACKFLRRKCISGCIFAPHFGSDQGAARFAAVHKVFGASNVSKLLLHIPLNRRHDAVVTITYEAQARLSDPVYGCVSTILALQQQVASLQAELATVQTQLINSRFAFANALQITSQQQQQNMALMLQPAYSNNTSTSTNLINMSSLTSNLDIDAAPSSQSFMEPLQLSRPSQDDEDDEEESRVPLLFANNRY
ncbi:LOB domain-containing protein 20-like [Pyrus ussuriensis x Pyrus communis]|uniref:LOB domain-containing protein 20-like n=1 Tax=Pyrus ussuriensis x Pyrus communis TaxID=2448454 RepID=A0A5N5FX70_9ROSA|nr:LOB domain-containing protein 20-like [Pyrus ussuriensis x Pyrus communis]